MINNYIDEREIKRAITTLKAPGELFEIRIIEGKTIYSGYFKSADKAIEEIAKQRLTGKNVFITLNEIKPACYSRAQHDCLIKVFREPTTGDKEITRYEWLLIDLDPERPAGISSTNEELEAAKEKAATVYKWLSEKGFKKPLAGMSGNGCHLLYKIDLENTSENAGIVENALKALDVLFSDALIKIDTSVFNPARISKLYGTTAQKGSSTEERPHRMSKLTSVPETIETTPIDKLKELAGIYAEMLPPAPAQRARNYNDNRGAFDVYEFLNNNGIRYTETAGKGYTKLILDECIFNPDHKAPDAMVTIGDNGALGYKCLHNSCSGNHWREFRLKLDPHAYDEDYDISEKMGYTTPAKVEAPAPAAELTKEEAAEMLNKNRANNLLADFIDSAALDTPCIKTGFDAFDAEMDGGLYPGLVILGAISSMGKTSFMLQLADQISAGKNDVLYFSLEMGAHELIAKSLSRYSYISAEKNADNAVYTRTITNVKKRAEMTTQQRVNYEAALDEYYLNVANNLWFFESVGDIGITEIKARIEKHAEIIGRVPLVFIDYLQVMKPINEAWTEKRNTDKAVLELRKLAREYNTTIFVISSLNRSSYKGDISMDAFKESGAIEYGSDVLLGLQPRGMAAGSYKKDEKNNIELVEDTKSRELRELELKVLKNRTGRTGQRINFEYNAKFNYFEEEEEFTPGWQRFTTQGISDIY